jgi:pyruvate carboxylase subunit B
MPGAVVSFEVEVGDTVAEGDVLLIVEAMKMESPIKAQKAGKILSIEVEPGDNVQSGDTLLYIG